MDTTMTIDPGIECDNYSLFISAIRNNDEEAVATLVQKGIFLKKDSANSKVTCPLELAISLQNLSIVRILLHHGACISAKIRSFNETALHYAVITRQRTMVLDLLRHGSVDWKSTDEKGASVLHMAFELGYVNFQATRSNGNLLRRKTTSRKGAVEQKIIDVLEIFLGLEMDVDARSSCGETALQLALRQGMVQVAEYLLAHGANVNVCDHEGNSLIHLLIEDEARNRCAIKMQQVEGRDNETTIDWLLQKGASASLVNAKGLTPVQLAMRHRLKGVLLLLLDYIEVGYVNGRGETWLHILMEPSDEWAAGWRDSLGDGELEDICEDLVDMGVPVDLADCYGSTALHVAALQRRPRLVRKMLDRFGNVAACDGLGRTVLHLVVDRCVDRQGRGIDGYDEVVRQLLAKGADLGRASRDGTTAVQLAAKHRQLRMLWIFKEHAADFGQCSAGGEGLLHVVAKSRGPGLRDEVAEKMTVEMLISQGCEVNTRSRSGHSPLHLACLYGNAQVAESLLKHGARVDCREDLMHWAPLHLAMSEAVLEALARRARGGGRRVDLDLADKNGLTALHLATMRGQPELVARLLALGASPRCRDSSRQRLAPLHLAVQRGDERIAALLLAADPASAHLAANLSGSTALHMAVEMGSLELARLLVRAGADVERRDERDRSSALHLAVRAGRPRLVEFLLRETHVDVNARQAFGETPLHVAVKYFRRGGAEVAGLLLRAAAQVDAPNLQAQTPLQYAIEYDCSEGVELLLQFGANVAQAFVDQGLFAGLTGNADMACHVIEHMVKLDALELERPIDQFKSSFDKRSRQFERLRERCRAEVEMLKARTIDDQGLISLYDLLHMRPRRRFVAMNTSQFSPTQVEEGFPKYYGFLWRAYHEALERKSLLATALDSWYLLAEFDLPSICVDQILGFLDNESLKNVIEAAEAIELEEIC